MSTSKNDEVVLTPSKAQILPTSDTSSTHSSSVGFEALNVEAPEKNPSVEDTIFGNEISKVHPLHLGKTLSLFYIKNQPLIVIGPDYPFTLSLIAIIVGVYCLEYFTIFENNAPVIKIIETVVFIIELSSYLITALINPGLPSRDYYAKNIENTPEFMNYLGKKRTPYLRCKKCNLLVLNSMNVTHCVICDVCVAGQDHHCPWTGKCIGKYNIYPFYVFVTFLFVFIMTSFVTFLTYIVFTIDKMSDQNKKF